LLLAPLGESTAVRTMYTLYWVAITGGVIVYILVGLAG
jgi:hypothetical protein